MAKVIMDNGGFYGCLSEAKVNLKAFQRGGRKQHKHVFIFSRSLLLKHFEPISSKTKLLLPMMPIGIVAYAFTIRGTTFVETAVYLAAKGCFNF